MKKLLSIFLVFSILLGISACGVTSAESVESAASAASAEASSLQEPPSPEPSEEPTPTPTPTPEIAVSAQDDESSAASELLEQDVVLVDDENCTVKLVSVAPDNDWGYTWNMYLENKTEQNLMFSMDDVSINGVMCDPFWATVVTAGKKANQEISWDPDEFEQIGITEVTVVEFNLSIYDDDDWNAADLLNETFTVYPLGEDAATIIERTPADSDITLFDNDSCTMLITGFDPDGLWGYTMNAYLINKTDKTLVFSIDDASVNDAMCNPFWASYVAPGKVSYASISWSPDDFEINDITTVEQIQLDISVMDDDLTTELVSDTFTIEP